MKRKFEFLGGTLRKYNFSSDVKIVFMKTDRRFG